MTLIDNRLESIDNDEGLDELEDEAITIIREVAAETRAPVLLFSGGKDSAVLLHLAAKAFRPGNLPFPVMHVDTGHNFDEVIEYRDRLVKEYNVRLVVASVQASIDAGRVVEETGPRASRNRLQSVTLLDAIAEHQFDAAFGGGRRDEDKARAKERILSFRDRFGQWEPRSAPASTCGPSPCRTGPNLTSGVTSPARAFRCPRSTSRTSASSSNATACC
jgi:sulfate adenylyltransferase subunit 2